MELLVAVSVMAVLALMAWQSLDAMARTERHTRERSDQLLALGAGLGQWAADLDALTETGEVPALDFDGLTLRMTRRDPLDTDTNSPGLRVVAWALHNGQWSRWQANNLQTRQDLALAWAEAQRWGQRPSEGDAARQVAVAKATQWQIFYHRDNAWSNPQSGADVALPDGVRLLLTLDPNQPLNGNLVRDWARPVLGGNKS